MKQRTLLLAAALWLVAGARGSAGTQEEAYVALAEGWSSASEDGPIEVAPRSFTAAEDFCASVAQVAELRTLIHLQPTVGQPYEMTFSILASNSNGDFLPRVPIALELHPAEVELIDRLYYQETGRLVLRRAQPLRIRVRTLCQSPEVTSEARLQVLAPGVPPSLSTSGAWPVVPFGAPAAAVAFGLLVLGVVLSRAHVVLAGALASLGPALFLAVNPMPHRAFGLAMLVANALAVMATRRGWRWRALVLLLPALAALLFLGLAFSDGR